MEAAAELQYLEPGIQGFLNTLESALVSLTFCADPTSLFSGTRIGIRGGGGRHTQMERHGPRTVIVISRQPQPQEILDAIMNGGDYDVVFVESMARAYSRVKRVVPDLVVLCLLIDDVDGYQVLSMLKLDSATSGIPVVTYETARPRVPAFQMH